MSSSPPTPALHFNGPVAWAAGGPLAAGWSGAIFAEIGPISSSPGLFCSLQPRPWGRGCGPES